MAKLPRYAKSEATKLKNRTEANNKARNNLRGKVLDDFFNYQPTRALAKEKGEDRYFTGKPCSFGNVALRYSLDARCLCDKCRDKHNKVSNLSKSKNPTNYLKHLEKLKAKEQAIRDLKKKEYRENQRELAKKNNWPEVIFVDEARELGLKYYFTGEKCSNGNFAKRLTCNRNCTCEQCQKTYKETKSKTAKKNYSELKSKIESGDKESIEWREKENKRAKQYRVDNQEKVKEAVKKSMAKWRKEHPEEYLVITRLRSRIIDLCRKGVAKKSTRSNIIIGCSGNQLVEIIESQFVEGMTWKNRNEWDIDHIRPCASFDLLSPEEMKVCFNWRNLQPLWKEENSSKSDNYSKKDEKVWIERMNNLGFEGELYLKFK